MRKVEAGIQINVSPRKVFNAFIEYKMLSEWWGVQKMFVQEKDGGVYTLTWNNSHNGFGYVFSGIIAKYRPNELLQLEQVVYLNPERPILGPMSLLIKIDAGDDFSVLSVCQSGYREGKDWDWYYEAVKSSWPVVLNTIKQYLEK